MKNVLISRFWLCVLMLLGAQVNIVGQNASLIKVLSTTPVSYHGLEAIGDQLTFLGHNSASEMTLWGFNMNTRRCEPLYPNSIFVAASAPIIEASKIGDRVVNFLYDTNTQELRLYSTNGEKSGTSIISQIPIPIMHPIYKIVAGNNVFFALKFPTRTELWRTDGTPTGTLRMETWEPNLSAGEFLFSQRENDLFFSIHLGNLPATSEVWKINLATLEQIKLTTVNGKLLQLYGGIEGLYELTSSTLHMYRYETNENELKSTFTYSASRMAISPDAVYIATSNFYNPSRAQILKLDRSTGITDIVHTHDVSYSFSFFETINGKIVYALGPHLYSGYNGTVSEIKKFKDITVSGYRSKRLGDRLVFVADDGIHGEELWATDGTSEGTYLLKDIAPGRANGFYTLLTGVNDLIYFRESSGLYRTDGTPEGTYQLFAGYLLPSESLFPVNDTIYFVESNGVWLTNGTTQGTRKLLSSVIDRKVHFLFPTSNQLFFIYDNGVDGKELWRSDGTEVGTYLVKDINPTGNSIDPSYRFSMVEMDGFVYFPADDGEHGREIWRSDGTSAGTQLVYDAYPASVNDGEFRIQVNNNRLYFFTNHLLERNLYSSDGTPEGTSIFRSRDMSDLISFKDNLYFKTWPQNSFLRTDGTIPGTINLGVVHNDFIVGWRKNSNRVFLFQQGSIFSNDGVSSTVDKVDNLSFAIDAAHSLNDTLYFLSGSVLWKTGGTTLDTKKIKNTKYRDNIYQEFKPNNFIGFRNKIYFLANDGFSQGMWQSNGTETGTFMFLDMPFQKLYSTHKCIYSVSNNKLYRINDIIPSVNEVVNFSVDNLVEFKDITYFTAGNKLYSIEDVDRDNDGFIGSIDCDDSDPQIASCSPTFGVYYGDKDLIRTPIIQIDPVGNLLSIESQEIKILNNGINDLLINSVTISGVDKNYFTLQTDSLKMFLSQNEYTQISIKFSPQRIGYHRAKLLIATNDSHFGLLEIPIYANSIAVPSFTIFKGDIPVSVDEQVAFGEVSVGDSITFDFKIKNNDYLLPVTFEASPPMKISGSDPEGFRVDQSTIPNSLPGLATVSFTITFKPSGAKEYVAELSLPNNDPTKSNFKLVLSGIGQRIVGVDEGLSNLISIYPNPSSDKIFIESEAGLNFEQVRFTDMFGHSFVKPVSSNGCILLEGLPTGLYYLTLPKDDKEWTFRVLKL